MVFCVLQLNVFATVCVYYSLICRSLSNLLSCLNGCDGNKDVKGILSIDWLLSRMPIWMHLSSVYGWRASFCSHADVTSSMQ